MSKTRVFVDEIVKLDRRNNSRAGNPAWLVTLKSGQVLRTQTDAACNYGMENPELNSGPVEITTVHERGQEFITYVREVAK